MTEDRVGFLCNIAFNLSPINYTHKLLRSYYLMRCNKVTKGYGLPPKYFSTKVRCPHCYMDWTRESDVKVHPLKLSKRQRQRIRSRLKSEHNKDKTEVQGCSQQNQMVQVCFFCKKSTTTHLIKPERFNKSTFKEHNKLKANNQTKQEKKTLNKQKNKNKTSSKSDKKNDVVNLYSNAFDVFSLKNENNTLSSTIKAPKEIKNNKKKKDKFAGLCQKAVLASAKLKQQKEKIQQPLQNKLNLFLKPSSE